MSITSEVRAPISHPDKLFVGGEWVTPSSDATIAVIEPATEELFFASPRRRHPTWIAPSPPPGPRSTKARGRTCRTRERAEYLTAFAAGLNARADDLGDIWPRQSGALHKIAKWSGMGAAGTFSMYAAMVDTFPFEERATPTAGGSFGLLVREPVGVVGAIIPWNAPIGSIANKVAPALIAGCTVVLKASPEAPGEAYVVAEIAEAIGLPPGVLNVLTADRRCPSCWSATRGSTRSRSPARPPRAGASPRSAASASPAAPSSSAGSPPPWSSTTWTSPWRRRRSPAPSASSRARCARR